MDLAAWVHQLRERFEQPVTLGLIFISPAYFEVAAEILEIVRTHAAVPLLVGCSSQWLIAGGTAIEEDAGIVLSLYSLPGAQLDTRHFSRSNSESDLPANEYQEEFDRGDFLVRNILAVPLRPGPWPLVPFRGWARPCSFDAGTVRPLRRI